MLIEREGGMYHPTKPVLWTEVALEGWRSFQLLWHSNGKYIRSDTGVVVGQESSKDPEIVYLSEVMGQQFSGSITDPILVERILRYWNEYFGKRHTNCSSFAHYLTTGEFVECDIEKQLLVLEQGMRPYEMSQRIDVGDMLCLLFADKSIATRRNQLANRYHKVQKHRFKEGGFTGTKLMKLQSRSFTPAEIRRVNDIPWIEDYHFMVCVAKRHGKPVWISQCGKHAPEDELVYFSVTLGETDPYFLDIPVFTFIKKRR